jgi:putative redox protein
MGAAGPFDAASIEPGVVSVSETRQGRFQQDVRTGGHRLLVDEPEPQGGADTGPGPYDLLAAALGACTSMTLRLYADFKKLPLEGIKVFVRHSKRHMEDCKECVEGHAARIDHFERVIRLDGDLDEAARQKLLAIADKCPVHNTLEKGSQITTQEDSQPQPHPEAPK